MRERLPVEHNNAVIRIMSVQQSHLIILCSNFPYGFGEPFLEVELNYLTAHFSQITICNTAVVGTACPAKLDVPDGVRIISVAPRITFVERLGSVARLMFDSEIWNEIGTIRKDYHSPITWGKLKTMLISGLRSAKIRRLLAEKVQVDDWATTYLYSYWADDGALAITSIKKEHPQVTAFCRLHGWDLYFERSTYHYLPFRRQLFNGLDAVLAISENGRNYLLSHFDMIINVGRVYQSRLGIRMVDRTEEHSRSFRRFRLISCSNLISVKRVELIVKALSHIEKLEVDWVHFGDGAESESTMELARAMLGNKENISFHFPGRVPNWQLLRYYADHMVDLFISLSRYDGIPVSIMEAMSFGIPAIATDVGGVSEIVINGRTGFLLDSEVDPKEVAKVIGHVADMDADSYTAMRNEARNMWGTFYSADINYPDFCRTVLGLNPHVAG